METVIYFICTNQQLIDRVIRNNENLSISLSSIEYTHNIKPIQDLNP